MDERREGQRTRPTERKKEKRRVREREGATERRRETKTGLMEGLVTVTNSCLLDTPVPLSALC